MIVVLGKGLFSQHFTKVYSDVPALSRKECDITSYSDITAMLKRYQPSVVINAAGIVPKASADILETLNTNSMAPRYLAELCDLYDCRLIHLSTNDVFSGHTGNYWEYDTPSPNSLYGISKALGEITAFPHLTVRSSFIGWPDDRGRGLLATLHKATTIFGYDKFMWNGLCAHELARLIMENLLPSGRCGLVHACGELVSKYDVLVIANEIFGWDVNIIKESEAAAAPHELDKSLHSKFGVVSQKSLRQQMEEMKELWNEG